MNSFYSEKELNEIGFKWIGKNVLISRKTSIYGAGNISIGNNVRIDDFCILSGKITAGDYIHIAAYCALFGGEKGIILEDFVGLSSRVTVYAASDDYSGNALTNPMIPDKYRGIDSREVVIKKHALVGTDSTILPGIVIGEGSSFGAKTLINHDSEPWSINIGIPFKKVKNRSKKILELEKQFLNEIKEMAK